MKINFESRTFSGAPVRADESQGDKPSLLGYACTFNTLSHDLGGFFERIAPTAFDRALSEGQDVRCLFNHDPSKLLGRTSAGTLQLSKDEKGLRFRCWLDPNQQWHRDLWASVKRADCTDCSFSFSVPDGGDEWDEGIDERGQRFQRRTLRDVNLIDCACVTYPAYPGTSVSARNASPVVQNALETLSNESWKKVMQQRADGVSRQILLDAAKAAEENRAREADDRLALSPEEHLAYLRRRAAAIGEEIERERQ